MHCVTDGGTLFTKGGQFPLVHFVRGGQYSLVNIVRGDTIPSDTGPILTGAQKFYDTHPAHSLFSAG